jgi:hypothetical protein
VGSGDHNVYCLNATSGALVWNYRTGFALLSSPAVAGGCVYVGSSDHKIYAFGNEFVPEFSSHVILPLLTVATLFTATICRQSARFHGLNYQMPNLFSKSNAGNGHSMHCDHISYSW